MGCGFFAFAVGLGERFRSGQDKNLAELGQDIMFVFPGRIPAVAGSYQSGQIYYLTYGDYFAIRDQARFLRAVSPVAGARRHPRGKRLRIHQRAGFRRGSEYSDIRNMPIETWALVQRRGQFAASPGRGSGMGIAEEYVSRPACRGSTILLNDMDFKVIGVIRRSAKRVRTVRIMYLCAFRHHANALSFEGANSENAISFINYRPIKKELHIEPRTKCMPSLRGDMASIPAWMTLFRIGTRSMEPSCGKDF